MCETKEDIEQALADTLITRFILAESLELSHGPLFDLLGYHVGTEAGQQILEGTFVPPQGTSEATCLIVDEIGRTWPMMRDGRVDITVTKEDYQYFWQRIRERTSSSFSGIHYGHYKACSHLNLLSEIHDLKISLISKTRATPEQWSCDLNVMLEKLAGVALVTKLRATLLMEADFNFHNRIVFAKRMLDNLFPIFPKISLFWEMSDLVLNSGIVQNKKFRNFRLYLPLPKISGNSYFGNFPN